MDNLVQTTETIGGLIGDQTDSVDFTFNGFTFTSTSEKLYLECSIVVCAVDDSNVFKDSQCGFNYGGDSCDAYNNDNTMGYTLAKSIVVVG